MILGHFCVICPASTHLNKYVFVESDVDTSLDISLVSDSSKLENDELILVMRIHFCDYKFDYFLICG